MRFSFKILQRNSTHKCLDFTSQTRMCSNVRSAGGDVRGLFMQETNVNETPTELDSCLKNDFEFCSNNSVH